MSVLQAGSPNPLHSQHAGQQPARTEGKALAVFGPLAPAVAILDLLYMIIYDAQQVRSSSYGLGPQRLQALLGSVKRASAPAEHPAGLDISTLWVLGYSLT